MELLHPSVMAGVGQQSNYREQPYRRARTTFGWVITTTFGSTAAAERLIARVKRMHSRVNGTRPDGEPYRALDPELIAWVHTLHPVGRDDRVRALQPTADDRPRRTATWLSSRWSA